MKPNRTLCLQHLSILLLFILSCASGHMEVISDDTPPVRSIQNLEARLSHIVDSSGRLSIRSIGRVEYDSFSAPVRLVTFTPREPLFYHVLVVGGIHGNEPAGVEAVLDLIQTVAGSPGKYNSMAFDFIPCVNPWGWAHDIRFNQNGRDINRDFASFKSREAAIIRDFVEGKTYDLILDHHEDPSAGGFYLYQYDKPDTILSRAVIENVRQAGFPIEQDVNMVVLKTDDGLINAPGWGLCYMKLTRQLSMTNYFRLNTGDTVYTIETPTRLEPEKRLAMHRIAQFLFIDDLLKRK